MTASTSLNSKFLKELERAENVANLIEGSKTEMADLVKRIVTIGRKLSRHGASVEAV